MVDRKHTLHQVEFKASYARNGAEPFADKGLFHGAVHVHNAEDGTSACRFAHRGKIDRLGLCMVVPTATTVFMRLTVLVVMAPANAVVVGGFVVMGATAGRLRSMAF